MNNEFPSLTENSHFTGVTIFTDAASAQHCTITDNGGFFAVVRQDSEFLKQQAELLKDVAHATITDYASQAVETPKGIISLKQLPVSVQTLLNVLYLKQYATSAQLVDVNECEDSMLPYLFEAANDTQIALYLSHPIPDAPMGYTYAVNGTPVSSAELVQSLGSYTVKEYMPTNETLELSFLDRAYCLQFTQAPILQLRSTPDTAQFVSDFRDVHNGVTRPRCGLVVNAEFSEGLACIGKGSYKYIIIDNADILVDTSTDEAIAAQATQTDTRYIIIGNKPFSCVAQCGSLGELHHRAEGGIDYYTVDYYVPPAQQQ